jgi:hypothetical protein
LKVPGAKRLKLKFDELLSCFAFNSSLRRYKLADRHIATPDELRAVIADFEAGPGRRLPRH